MQSPKSVAAIIFNCDRTNVLMIQRRDVPVWVLPGGGIDPGETAESAVVREVLEETGFKVSIKRLVGAYTPISKLAKFTHLYECVIEEGTATLCPETRDIQFFPLKALPKLIPPPYPEWIRDGVIDGPTVYKPITSATYFALFKSVFLHPLLVFRFVLARIGLTINS